LLTLQRITSEFIAPEDRFRLSGATGEGGEVSYWVTQRLMRRLLKVVFDWLAEHRGELERQTATELFAPVAGRAESRQGAATQAAAATQATAGAAPAEPEPVPGRATELVLEADIRMAATQISLTVKPASGEHSQLSLQLNEAWQWLLILRTLWQRAEWDASLWPDWFEQVQAPRPTQSWGSVH